MVGPEMQTPSAPTPDQEPTISEEILRDMAKQTHGSSTETMFANAWLEDQHPGAVKRFNEILGEMQ